MSFVTDIMQQLGEKDQRTLREILFDPKLDNLTKEDGEIALDQLATDVLKRELAEVNRMIGGTYMGEGAHKNPKVVKGLLKYKSGLNRLIDMQGLEGEKMRSIFCRWKANGYQ